MKEFNATNTGNRVIISCASFEDVKRLKQVILKEIMKSPLGINIVGKVNNLFETDINLSGIIEFIKNLLIGLDASDEFEEAIFKCLIRCTYKTTYKIDKDLFDTKCPEAREDYYEIITACIEENLNPFIKSLISVLKTRLSQNAIIQGLFQPQDTKTE